QRENVLGLVAVIHDVEDVVDGDARSECGREPVADELQRLGKAGAGRAVAGHANSDRIAHAGPYTRAVGNVLGSPQMELCRWRGYTGRHEQSDPNSHGRL